VELGLLGSHWDHHGNGNRLIIAESHVKQLEGAPNPRVNKPRPSQGMTMWDIPWLFFGPEATLSEGLSAKYLINI
jgi:hypothetical protein